MMDEDIKKAQAEVLLPKVAEIIWSDLMKAHHYADKAIDIAILAGNLEVATSIAKISVDIAQNIKLIAHIGKIEEEISREKS